MLLLGPILIGRSGSPCGTAGGAMTGAMMAGMATHEAATPASGSHDSGPGAPSHPCDAGGPRRGCPMTPGSATCLTMTACGPAVFAVAPAAVLGRVSVGAAPFVPAVAILHSISSRPEPPPPRG